MSGKAEWTELRIRTKLTAAELDAVLIDNGRQNTDPLPGNAGPNQAVILLKSG